jgi:hypothetical protein
MSSRIRSVLILLSLFSMTVQAQKKKPAAAMQQFTKSLASMSEAPVNMQLTIVNHSDVIFDDNDRFSMQAVVHLQKASSYVRFGEIEQLATDSLLLIVSDSLEQLILMPRDANAISNQLTALPGMKKGDLTPDALNKKYTAEFVEGDISLKSRALLTGTSLPRESIRLSLDKSSLDPFELKMIRRSLVPIDSTQAESLKQELPDGSSRLVTAGTRLFFIKETATSFIYRQIDRTVKELPIHIQDRVQKNEAGQWEPVKSYEAYRFVNQTND